MAQSMHGLDLAVLVVYFSAILATGIYFWRRSRTVDTFTAAGRSLPGWVCGLSILATYVSSISFLALPGKAYASNWNPFAFSLSLPLATWIAVKYFVPYYKESGDISAYSHLERRFGTWARVYAGICYLLTQFARMGAVLYLMALPMSLLLGWDIRWIILITGAAVIVYTFMGGIIAVIWTDAIQCLILMAGAFLCAVLVFFSMPDGPGQLFSIASANHKFSLGSFGSSLAEPTFWVVLFYGMIINLQNFGIDQSYVQRYVASSSVNQARKGLWLGGLLYLPLSAGFFFIGTGLFAFYQSQPELLPEPLHDAAKADSVFPHFIVTELPNGLSGLLIAAIFAAAMSSLSTSLNSSATLILSDFYKRFFRKNASESESMRVLLVATVVWGGLGTALALAMIHVQSALDAWWMLSGIFSGGMLGLFLLGMISRKAGNPAACAGVICGVLVIAWMTFSRRLSGSLEYLRSPFHSFLITVFGTIAILLVGLFITKFVKNGTVKS